jgi:hypothetical protein
MKRCRLAWAMGVLATAIAAPATVFAADSQIRPFIGSTFHGDTSFVDLEHAAPGQNLVVGVSWVTLGDVFGFDAELADAPGFFQSGNRHLVLSSRVTTVTGNVIISAPRRFTEYTLRPYFVAGGGLMRVRIDDSLDALPVSRVLPAFDVGGGVMTFFTNHVGVSGEMRRFQNLYRQSEENGLTFGNERLSFWRATVAFVYRY